MTAVAQSLRSKATAAVKRMQQTRGHVVIGYEHGELQVAPEPGDRVHHFANYVLLRGALEVIGETDREDWDAQVRALFGSMKGDPNPHAAGERFFHCRYLPDAE